MNCGSQYYQSLFPVFPEYRHSSGSESDEVMTDVLQDAGGWLSVLYIKIRRFAPGMLPEQHSLA